MMEPGIFFTVLPVVPAVLVTLTSMMQWLLSPLPSHQQQPQELAATPTPPNTYQKCGIAYSTAMSRVQPDHGSAGIQLIFHRAKGRMCLMLPKNIFNIKFVIYVSHCLSGLASGNNLAVHF